MTRTLLVSMTILGITVSSAFAQAPQGRSGSGPVPPERAFLDAYCLTYHNTKMRTANLMLDKIDVTRPAGDAEVWEKVVRKLRVGAHPPRRPEAPDKPAVIAFISGLEAALDRAAPAYWTSASAVPLDDMALASRLAAFLWKGEPDAELRTLARRGQLTNPSVLEQQARRMLKDARLTAFVTGFFDEWLYLKNIRTMKRSVDVFPSFDTSLINDFERETKMFLDYQVREDHSVLELWSANYTFLNDRLARHYGVSGIKGGHFRRVPLADDARGGLLGQASILTITSYSTRTSAVIWGKWVLEIILGAAMPTPPANTPALKEGAGVTGTMRERLAAHTKHPACASCHVVIDPIGLGLENFDAVGRWRDTDGSRPIDASDAFADGTSFNGPGDLRRALVNEHSDAIVTKTVERLLAEALGRRVGYVDLPAVRVVVREAAAQGHRWSALVTGIVRSAPFQMRRLEEQPLGMSTEGQGKGSVR